VGARQRWEAVGRSKKLAERRLAEVVAQVSAGTYRQLPAITVKDFCTKWLTDYAAGSVKPTSLRFYRGLITNHLVPAFGPLRLTDLTPEIVQRYLATSLREARVSARTINHSLMVLKQVLNRAKRWSYLRENPAEGVRPLRIEPEEMDYLKPTEIPLLLRHADEPHRTLFMTAVLTGMRLGEVLALQWGDVDWQGGRIQVRRSIFWYLRRELDPGADDTVLWRFTTPKSKHSRRNVIMSPALKEALELYRLVCPASPHDLVFCTKTGTPIEPRNLVRREFEPALARAGLRKIRFHDLRHTYTALLIAQGVNVKAIQAQLGHGSVQTTLDRYGHLLPESSSGIGEALDRQIGASQGASEVHVRLEQPPRANTVLTEHAVPPERTVDHQRHGLPQLLA
jgi:integrase